MGRRPGMLVAVGAVLLIVGAAIVFLVLKDDNKKTPTATAAPTATTRQIAPSSPTGMAVPAGKQAVAVTTDYTAGGAGYVTVGDHVSIYTLIQPSAPGASGVTPYSRMLVGDAQVLGVSTLSVPEPATVGTTPTTTASTTPSPPTVTLVVALTSQQAEEVAFGTTFDKLYVGILAKGEKPGATGGVGYGHNYVAQP